jgi:hypothetical protein
MSASNTSTAAAAEKVAVAKPAPESARERRQGNTNGDGTGSAKKQTQASESAEEQERDASRQPPLPVGDAESAPLEQLSPDDREHYDMEYAASMATEAFILRIKKRLEDLAGVNRNGGGHDEDVWTHTISIDNLKTALERLEPCDPIKTDIKVMMVFRVLTQGKSNNKSRLTISWINILHLYKMFIVSNTIYPLSTSSQEQIETAAMVWISVEAFLLKDDNLSSPEKDLSHPQAPINDNISSQE